MSRRITDSTAYGTLYGDVNGVNKVYTTRYAVEPGMEDQVHLLENGVRGHRNHGGDTNDYDFIINNFTIQITMTNAPETGAIIDVDYDPIGGRLG